MIIRCARCGRSVGSVESYSYGGAHGEDHIDYNEPDYFENYGGDRDGDSYCDGCFHDEPDDDEEQDDEDLAV
jgi:hypothetical protein